MSHCLKVTSDFHRICCFFVHWKSMGRCTHHIIMTDWTACTFFHRLYFLFTSNWIRSARATQLRIYSVLDSAQKCDELLALMSLWIRVTDGESLSGVWRWLSQTNNRTNFSASLQQMQPTTDNNLLRPILPEHKYLPWQAIHSNQPLYFDGPLHTRCIIFWGQVLGYFLFT